MPGRAVRIVTGVEIEDVERDGHHDAAAAREADAHRHCLAGPTVSEPCGDDAAVAEPTVKVPAGGVAQQALRIDFR